MRSEIAGVREIEDKNESEGGRLHLLALLGQPGVELGTRLLGNVDETKTSAAGFVHPGNLDFRFQGGGGSRQLERSRGDDALGQRAAKENRHSTLAEVGHGRLELLAFAK